jgi:hypothetical protein
MLSGGVAGGLRHGDDERKIDAVVDASLYEQLREFRSVPRVGSGPASRMPIYTAHVRE